MKPQTYLHQNYGHTKGKVNDGQVHDLCICVSTQRVHFRQFPSQYMEFVSHAVFLCWYESGTTVLEDEMLTPIKT
jgi:hypothetical protein